MNSYVKAFKVIVCHCQTDRKIDTTEMMYHAASWVVRNDVIVIPLWRKSTLTCAITDIGDFAQLVAQTWLARRSSVRIGER